MTFTNETSAGLLDELARVKAERDDWARRCQRAQQDGAILLAERDKAQGDLDAALEELRGRTSERDCLAERLRQSPEMREVIGELRKLKGYLCNHYVGLAQEVTEELLRRLDRESQEGA